jgi:hypothetical protein
MKTTLLIFVTALCILLFEGCSSKSGDTTSIRESRIPVSENIAYDSMPMHEIIRIHRWIRMDNRVIIQTNAVDTLFYVYTLPDFRYHSRFGLKGQGPDEFMLPTIATDGEKKLYVYDDADKISIYAFRDSGFVYDDRIPYSGPMIVAYLLRIDDKTFFTKETPAHEIRLRLLAMENDKLVQQDEFVVESDLHGTTSRYYFSIANYGKNIATAYMYKNQIHLYRAEDGHIERPLIIKTTGFMKPVKEDGDNYFFTDLNCDESYIYALYQGRSPVAQIQDRRSSVIIYNWSGEAVKELIFDRRISHIIVDREAGYIYAVYPYNSDYIYRYKFNI